MSLTTLPAFVAQRHPWCSWTRSQRQQTPLSRGAPHFRQLEGIGRPCRSGNWLPGDSWNTNSPWSYRIHNGPAHLPRKRGVLAERSQETCLSQCQLMSIKFSTALSTELCRSTQAYESFSTSQTWDDGKPWRDLLKAADFILLSTPVVPECLHIAFCISAPALTPSELGAYYLCTIAQICIFVRHGKKSTSVPATYELKSMNQWERTNDEMGQQWE